jgi:hypothetical protein
MEATAVLATEFAMEPQSTFSLLSVQYSGSSLIRSIKLSFALSVSILSCGLVSGMLGLISQIYIYAVLANIMMVCYPFALYYTLKLRFWTRGLLLLQSIVSCTYQVLLVVVNSFIIVRLVKAQRYCFGDLNSDCQSVDKAYDLLCDQDEDGEGMKVWCPDQVELTLKITSICVNFLTCGLLILYLLGCLAVRRYLPLTLHVERAEEFPHPIQKAFPIHSLFLKIPVIPQLSQADDAS